MKDPRREADRWLEQAEHDLSACEYMIKGSFYSNACFLAQQSAEKAVKAYLYFKGQRTVYNHSVVELVERSASFDKEFDNLINEASFLDRFYIQARYPDALPGSVPYKTFIDDDGKKALSACEKILKLVKGKIS